MAVPTPPTADQQLHRQLELINATIVTANTLIRQMVELRDQVIAMHDSVPHAPSDSLMEGSAPEPAAPSGSVDNTIPIASRSGGMHIVASHKGRLHAWAHGHGYHDTKEGKLPAAAIEAAKHSPSGHVRQEANFAANARHFHHGQ